MIPGVTIELRDSGARRELPAVFVDDAGESEPEEGAGEAVVAGSAWIGLFSPRPSSWTSQNDKDQDCQTRAVDSPARAWMCRGHGSGIQCAQLAPLSFGRRRTRQDFHC